MARQLSIAAHSTGQTLTLTVRGELNGVQADATAFHDAVSAASACGLIVFDLRELRLLTPAGIRMLRAVAEALAAREVRCHLVVDPAGTVATVLGTALPPSTAPVFGTLDQALQVAGPTERPVTDAQDPLAAQLAMLTRFLVGSTTVGAALQRVVDAAQAIVPGAALVSITLRDASGVFFTPVETDDLATALDQVQYRSGRGPCLDAARLDGPAFAASDDLATETRWPQFAAAAAERGLVSILSTDLLGAERPAAPRGALNIYSRSNRGLSTSDRYATLLLASHAALALAYASVTELADLRERQLRRAIESRDVIGQAKGILMGRQGLTAEQAFDVLRRTSQDLNVKLVDLARALASRSGELDRP